MKKLILFLFFSSLLLASRGQSLSARIDSAKAYVDTNIINNTTRSITPYKLNVAYHKVIHALEYIDSVGVGAGSLKNRGSAFRVAKAGTDSLNTLYGNWGVILDSLTTGQIGLTVDTSSGKVATQTMVNEKASRDLTNLTITSINNTPIGAGVNSIKNRTGQYYRDGSVFFMGDSYLAIPPQGATSNRKGSATLICEAMGATQVNYAVAGVTLEKQIPINYMASPNAVDDTVRIPYKAKYNKLLVFGYGLNDVGAATAPYNPSNFISDYTLVLNNAIAKGWLPNQILLIPPYWIGSAGYAAYSVITGGAAPTVARHLDFIAATKTVSQTFGTMYFDIYTDQKNNDTTLLHSDNIHPNDAGYAFIAESVLQYLGVERVTQTNGVNISFQSVTNVTNQGSLWYASSGASYGQTGLCTNYNLPANQNGRLSMTGNSLYAVLGFNSANAQTGYTGIEAGFLIDHTGLVYSIDGGAVISSGVTVAATTLVSIYRSGAGFYIQTSTDEAKTWTTIATLAYTSTAVHYIVSDIRGTSFPGYMFDPEFSTGISLIDNMLAGTYTPTLTNVANVAASTAYSCQYSRVGSVVTVTGEVDIDPTTTLTLTRLGISLPIASNLANTNELAGNCGDDLSEAGRVIGDATNNRAEVRLTPTDVTNRRFSFNFTYRIL